MKMRCQDGSIEVTPDCTDDVVSLVVRDDAGRQINLTLSRSTAQHFADAVQDVVIELAEYDDD